LAANKGCAQHTDKARNEMTLEEVDFMARFNTTEIRLKRGFALARMLFEHVREVFPDPFAVMRIIELHWIEIIS